MARGRGEAEDRWWVRDLAGYDDPISLDPLRMLRYPPFELRADLALGHGTNSDWFDGKVLATYLISTGNFFHPMSRREVRREECEALDQYLRVHGLGKPAVTEAYDQREAYGSPEGMPPDSRVYALRAEADMLLQALFSAQHTRREEGARSARRRAAGEAVVREGNFALVDDDQRPSHATGREEAAAGREEGGGAARTVPGAELSRPAAATPRCASHGSPAGGAAAADAAEAESFPALVSERLPPREEAAWLPARGGAMSARFAATGATTRGRPAAWAAAAAHAPPHRTAAHMPTRAPAAQPLTLVSRAPTSTVPAPAAAPKKTKGQRKAAAKQRKAAASAGASASVGSDGESDGEEEGAEGVGAAEGSGDAAASSAWSAAPRLPSDMEEIKARNKLLLLALRRRLAEGGVVEEAAGQLLAAFKEACAAYMASGGAGAREYIDAFLQLFGVEGSAPLLLELGALLPSSTLRHAFNAALRAMWGLPQLEAPSAASSSHAPPPSPAPPSVATPPHRTSAGVVAEYLPTAPVAGVHLPIAPVVAEYLPTAPVAGVHFPIAPVVAEQLPTAPVAGVHLPIAPVVAEQLPTAPVAGVHLPIAPVQVKSAPCGTPAPSVWTTRPPLPQKTAPKPAAPPKPKPPKAKPSQSAPAPAPPPPAAPVSAASISSAIFGNMSAVSAAAAASAAAELENSATAAKAASGYASKQPKPKGRR
ncbi:hypothetical protein AB1Y20_007347 [Prymnesium parvum]|uniref:Uncharacterized protein n=1 Tax=Prymnesium parvum TaxID=97485 RepID=A0AB34IVV0_PRYPA